MAIDIFWATTKRIFVPRTDMTLVQASPEVRELNVDTFRLALKDLEAAVEGMPWPDTHRHNTQVTISGLTLARVVEILPPYFVEFEDGAYAVRAVGANHNILDRKISNSVSFLASNSAGLINNATPATIADAVLDEVVSGHLTAGTFGAYMDMLHKTQYNRLELDLATQELVLYNDAGTAVIRRWPLETNDGSPITAHTGIQTKRKQSY